MGESVMESEERFVKNGWRESMRRRRSHRLGREVVQVSPPVSSANVVSLDQDIGRVIEVAGIFREDHR
jgi:hypothetical protein